MAFCLRLDTDQYCTVCHAETESRHCVAWQHDANVHGRLENSLLLLRFRPTSYELLFGLQPLACA